LDVPHCLYFPQPAVGGVTQSFYFELADTRRPVRLGDASVGREPRRICNVASCSTRKRLGLGLCSLPLRHLFVRFVLALVLTWVFALFLTWFFALFRTSVVFHVMLLFFCSILRAIGRSSAPRKWATPAPSTPQRWLTASKGVFGEHALRPSFTIGST
jgi:hypothetical protein